MLKIVRVTPRKKTLKFTLKIGRFAILMKLARCNIFSDSLCIFNYFSTFEKKKAKQYLIVTEIR